MPPSFFVSASGPRTGKRGKREAVRLFFFRRTFLFSIALLVFLSSSHAERAPTSNTETQTKAEKNARLSFLFVFGRGDTRGAHFVCSVFVFFLISVGLCFRSVSVFCAFSARLSDVHWIISALELISSIFNATTEIHPGRTANRGRGGPIGLSFFFVSELGPGPPQGEDHPQAQTFSGNLWVWSGCPKIRAKRCGPISPDRREY